MTREAIDVGRKYWKVKQVYEIAEALRANIEFMIAYDHGIVAKMVHGVCYERFIAWKGGIARIQDDEKLIVSSLFSKFAQ
jgi:hypothetical protein